MNFPFYDRRIALPARGTHFWPNNVQWWAPFILSQLRLNWVGMNDGKKEHVEYSVDMVDRGTFLGDGLVCVNGFFAIWSVSDKPMIWSEEITHTILMRGSCVVVHSHHRESPTATTEGYHVESISRVPRMKWMEERGYLRYHFWYNFEFMIRVRGKHCYSSCLKRIHELERQVYGRFWSLGHIDIFIRRSKNRRHSFREHNVFKTSVIVDDRGHATLFVSKGRGDPVLGSTNQPSHQSSWETAPTGEVPSLCSCTR